MNVDNLKSIPILRLSPEAVLPTRAHADDAGLDIYSLEDIFLGVGQGKAARTGIALAIPQGHVGMVADRSSLGKRGIKTAGGIVDAGYRGEVHVVLWNISGTEVHLKKGERIAQLLILPIQTPAVEEVTTLDETQRCNKGFGSSGR